MDSLAEKDLQTICDYMSRKIDQIPDDCDYEYYGQECLPRLNPEVYVSCDLRVRNKKNNKLLWLTYNKHSDDGSPEVFEAAWQKRMNADFWAAMRNG